MKAMSELNKADVKKNGVTSTKAIDREREKFMDRETNKPVDIDVWVEKQRYVYIQRTI